MVGEPATQVVPSQSPTVKVELVSRRIPVAWQFHEWGRVKASSAYFGQPVYHPQGGFVQGQLAHVREFRMAIGHLCSGESMQCTDKEKNGTKPNLEFHRLASNVVVLLRNVSKRG